MIKKPIRKYIWFLIFEKLDKWNVNLTTLFKQWNFREAAGKFGEFAWM